MANLPRSASVTAAATLALLGSITAFFIWGSIFCEFAGRSHGYYWGRDLNRTNNMGHSWLIAVVPSALIALGIQTGIGLFQLRGWARLAALIWASIALLFCLVMIAFRPFETFYIPERFVTELNLSNNWRPSYCFHAVPY